MIPRPIYESGVLKSIKTRPAVWATYFALCLHASGQTWETFVSKQSIAQKTGFTREAIRLACLELVRLGLIVDTNRKVGRAFIFRVEADPQKVLGYEPPANPNVDAADTTTPVGRNPNAGRPNPQHWLGLTDRTYRNKSPESSDLKIPKKQESESLWDLICSVFSINPQTESDKSRVGKLTRDFLQKGATPEELEFRLGQLEAEWGKRATTPEALLKHWDRFDDKGGDLLLRMTEPTDDQVADIADRLNSEEEAAHA